MPPTGSTFPRSVISPVIAMSLRTGIRVTADRMDVATERIPKSDGG